MDGIVAGSHFADRDAHPVLSSSDTKCTGRTQRLHSPDVQELSYCVTLRQVLAILGCLKRAWDVTLCSLTPPHVRLALGFHGT